MEEKRNLREQGKLLLPKLDVVFHALFREENKDILGVLVSDIIKEEVKIKTIDKNRYVNIIEANDKLGKRGEKYRILKKTISIAILDHEIEALKGIDELGIKWQIREELTGLSQEEIEKLKE